MKERIIMYKFIFSVLIFAVASSVAFAQEDDADANTPGPAKCAKLQASTVFIPDKAGSRQKGSASIAVRRAVQVN
jgi:hypothetical protein